MEKEYFELLSYFIFILLTLLGYFCINYFKEKGKNKALAQDNKKLTDQIEQVKQKYKLDLEKRKYQYESKQEQYMKFLEGLDVYNDFIFNRLFKDLAEVMMKFYMSKSEEETNKYTTEYNNIARTIDTDLKKQSKVLFSQLIKLKIVSNPDIISLLEELQKEIISSNKRFDKLTNDYLGLLKAKKTDFKDLKTSEDAKKIIYIKEKLIDAIKNDLNEI